jgi:hypothetical protein
VDGLVDVLHANANDNGPKMNPAKLDTRNIRQVTGVLRVFASIFEAKYQSIERRLPNARLYP